MPHPTNIKKEETPQVLPRSQASQVSATRSLYLQFILQWEWGFGLCSDLIYIFYILIMQDKFRICNNLLQN